MTENKHDSESSDEDQFQEGIVTSGDGGMRRVLECDPQPTDIYRYIGQIYAVFDYMDKYKYRSNMKGTGTVVFINNDLVYVLTCAHNMRQIIMHCIPCDIYRIFKDKNGKTSCSQCGEKTGSNQQKKIIKATKIKFMARSIKSNDFGTPLIPKDYICTEQYIPDTQYMGFPMPKDGFDWAFLSFLDIHGIYKKHPNIELVNGMDIFSEPMKIQYGIFGYPGDKNDKMWGMISDADNYKQFTIKQNKITKQHYLHQVAIDTAPGESGAALWFKQNDNEIVKICAIHCGGGKGKRENIPYNIATLVGTDILRKWYQIKTNDKSFTMAEESEDEKSPFKAFVGIDFGTDGSGLAYCLRDGSAYIHNMWGLTEASEKPKTSVLFGKDDEVLSVGSEAQDMYIKSLAKEWKLFERFKMSLYDIKAEEPGTKNVLKSSEEKLD
eukprot:453369_1